MTPRSHSLHTSSPHHSSPHPRGVYKDSRSRLPPSSFLTLCSLCSLSQPPSHTIPLLLELSNCLHQSATPQHTCHAVPINMRLTSGLSALTLSAVALLGALVQPAAASSLYHETCTGACNGAYAHCCAHVTGVIGEYSKTPSCLCRMLGHTPPQS